MKRSALYLSVFALTLFLTGGQAPAVDNQDPVTSGQGESTIVRNTFGTCVRTKWQTENDPCAPAPAPVAAPAPPPPAPRIMLDKRTVYFDFDRANLTDSGVTTLNNLATLIQKNGQVTKMTVVGYTDVLGSDSYNDKLSQKRANNVQTHLAKYLKIPSDTTVRGLGKSHTADCAKHKKRSKQQKECLAPDRRVEVELTYMQ